MATKGRKQAERYAGVLNQLITLEVFILKLFDQGKDVFMWQLCPFEEGFGKCETEGDHLRNRTTQAKAPSLEWQKYLIRT